MENMLEGGWFSTNDLKLAVSLHAADFPFKQDGECTRIKRDGRETFTWHFEPVNRHGQPIKDFLYAWENPTSTGLPRPDPMTCFLVSREIMHHRTHIIAESNRVPAHLLLSRGDKRLAVTASLGRDERAQLSRLAS